MGGQTALNLAKALAEGKSRRTVLKGLLGLGGAALAGSVEYSAMERVFEIHERGEYDLVVVDTPPAQHALDFLEAPQRLIEFLDSRIVQVLIHPAFTAGRVGFRLFQRGTRRVLQVMERMQAEGWRITEYSLSLGSERGASSAHVALYSWMLTREAPAAR